MNSKNKKLELCWPGKDIEVKPEPRVLIEDPEKSYGESDTENMIINADNLLALKALEQKFTGKIKCIYIDPPYNTGNAFEHYDDGIEHSIWLNLMNQRLRILKKLLSEEGVIFVQIDDSEAAYLKVLMDEIFGRNNYETTFYVQVRYGNKTLNEDNNYQKLIEQILVYKKPLFKPNKKLIDYSIDKFCWKIVELSTGITETIGGRKVQIFKDGEYLIEQIKPSITGLKETWATGSLVKQGGSAAEFFDLHLAKRKNIDGLNSLYKVIDMGTRGDGLGYRYITGPKKVSATKGKFYTGIPLDQLSDIKAGTAKKEVPISNFYDYAANFGNCRLEGNVSFNGGKKPEDLISMILEIGSKEGDLILDSFLGSGTTAAVAHKMKRKYIGVELGKQAYTHVLERLKLITQGKDTSGVTKNYNWAGGGGFKYYNLAPSLLNKDKYNQWIINPNYNADLLAAAMARLEGFTYLPDDSVIWKQGSASEHHFIFTTTNTITYDVIEQILSEMKPDESLLICCAAFIDGCNEISNRIEIKKIPEVLLGKCEFGKEDYSTDMNIVNMPVDPDRPCLVPSYIQPESKPTTAKIKKNDPLQTNLLF